jgi:hypothetical protein
MLHLILSKFSDVVGILLGEFSELVCMLR